jgi:2-hydroxychromene-2-carboxylate isomerase
MSRSVDYYFSLVSPWAYIGHTTFMDLMRRHDAPSDRDLPANPADS